MNFQWLKDYQELDEQIHYLKWNLNKSKLELNRWVYGDLSGVRLERNSRSSSLEENIQRIESEVILLENEKAELIELIDTFKGVDNQIVKMKYIDDLTIEEIAEEIGYSISYVRKRYTEINKTLDFVEAYESRKQERRNKQNETEYAENKLRRKGVVR